MRVVLAAMPWQAVNRPSLPIGLLHGLVRRERPEIEVAEYHGCIRWVEFLLAASAGALGTGEYADVADNGVFYGLGDWVFAGGLYDDPAWTVEEMRAYAEAEDVDISLPLQMRSFVPGFLEAAAAEVLASDPDVVGFTSTFMQNGPSLALARRLKRLRPEIQIVFGGANCDGPMGAALHRNHPFVDYVVRGEGEAVFPALLDRIEAGEDPAGVPGVCWWDGDRSVANPQAAHPVPPGMLPTPDFDAWHETLEQSPVREHVTPQLVLEGSRGCWWGEKHQCTFCGLNGSLIAFRARPADRFWEELKGMVERYQILDVVPVDNILDMQAFRTLLPKMAEADWDLRMHYEVKSNLRTEQVEALAAAKIVTVQPGIESLNGRVLKIMDKGVDGATNVRLLRDCEDNHVTVAWNYLYGFPGERAEDYRHVIEQMDALVHLPPPENASRIALERFSPYFERPELGFARRAPAAYYRHVYALEEAELADLAYFFTCDDAGISDDVAAELRAAIARWRRDYPYSFLVADDQGDRIIIDDRRRGYPRSLHHLSGWRTDAYRALGRRRSAASLHAMLTAQGHTVNEPAVGAWLRGAMRHGLVFNDGSGYVALATRDAPYRLVDTEHDSEEIPA
ncbi:RiPP maturation radical SAM C-methyltransferase [Actinomadura sp. HBU206391]|uniref:RiPP maturation radical SAM C-methyltransferase n=1 Tax=Actinomadura sp. HBU206391 TaxID=2731692 RepID=UPI0016501AE2|nr:RiPP maturation radical SAM C-methyltransferase [Actinomadura sp. HBU206391]MBC6462653.1 RiPP maturation radical SAM protein 1 [Actinomadura sp. HBU206391]